MSKCMSCGGFVTDNYARVFGDNDDNVFDCRNCRTDRRLGDADEEEDDDGKVLLRTVRGDDEDYSTGRGSATTPDGESGPGESVSTPAVADGGVPAAAADEGADAEIDAASQADAETATAPGDDDERTDESVAKGGDDRGRFSVGRFLSGLRS